MISPEKIKVLFFSKIKLIHDCLPKRYSEKGKAWVSPNLFCNCTCDDDSWTLNHSPQVFLTFKDHRK
jgi:hypothetical protein